MYASSTIPAAHESNVGYYVFMLVVLGLGIVGIAFVARPFFAQNLVFDVSYLRLSNHLKSGDFIEKP
jgi:hypothetical protein